MKNWTSNFVVVVSVFVGVVIGAFAIQSGYSTPATWLLAAPTLGAVIAASFTVFAHGKLEHQREAAAAFISYAVLALLTALAYFIHQPEILGKFVDAFLFGQVVALLSVAKTCLQSWNDPVIQEDPGQRAARHAEAARIRKSNSRSARSGRPN